MLMSGMLIVGTVPGNVLASELQADFGQASEIAAEVPEGTDTEEVCWGWRLLENWLLTYVGKQLDEMKHANDIIT